MDLQGELDEAIENWRRTWKSGDMDRILQLYTEDVRVMRSGRNIVVGREQLRPTMHELRNIGWSDIQFYSDEIGGIASGGEHSQVYQRYHEALVREDGSEIGMIYGMMIWKKVNGSWLIDVYANCPVPAEPTNTIQLKESIQRTYNQLGQAWASHSVEEALKYYSDDCLLMPPGERLKGKVAIRKYLEKSFASGCRLLTVGVESVRPMFEVYVVSHLVHVTYPFFTISDGDGKVIASGSGNAVVSRVGNNWEITEAVWNTV